MKLILLGAPASGKGTLARQISKDFNLPHISTGALFRESILKGEKEGLTAQSYMQTGQLVPDDLTVGILTKRLAQEDCKRGFILDGFPRTINQARLLQKEHEIDAVILLDIDLEEVSRRILGRVTCSNCGEIYNTSFYSEEACSKCGGTLERRGDDNEQTIKSRFEVYQRENAPLITFYENKIKHFAGQERPEQLYKLIKCFLEKSFKGQKE